MTSGLLCVSWLKSRQYDLCTYPQEGWSLCLIFATSVAGNTVGYNNMPWFLAFYQLIKKL